MVGVGGGAESELECPSEGIPGGELVVGVHPFEPSKGSAVHEKGDEGKALLGWCLGKVKVLFGLKNPV